MVNVGCKFAPNDLAPGQWRDLIVLAIEREWLRERITEYREKKKPLSNEEAYQLAKVRREQGIPAEGESIFPKKRRR